jgi:hypothetical protein
MKTEPEIWKAIVARFSWAEQERGGSGAGLAFRDFVILRIGLERAAESRDIAVVSDILAFVEQLLQEPLHPEVLHALDSSFIEDLYLLGEPRHRDVALPLLGPRTRQRWLGLADAYRQIGVEL